MVTRRTVTLVFLFLVVWILPALVLPSFVASAAPGAGGFIVTRLDDPAPDGCQPTDCSLREALIAADVPGGATVTFALSGTIELSRGALEIYGGTLLTGLGAATTTINANGLSAVFAVFESTNNPAPACSPTISSVTIAGGNAPVGGGVLVEADCTFALLNSVVRDNTASNAGGGIGYGGSGSPTVPNLIIRNSAIVSNTAPHGGGIWVENHHLLIENSTISGNSATGKGGGIYFTPASTIPFAALLQSVTIANNHAMTGDAFAYEEPTPPQESAVRLFNTVLAATTGSACATIGFDTLTFQSLGFNLSTDPSCNLSGLADIPDSDPQLAPLRWDGATFVHLPAVTSPILDSGASGALTTDQRGLPRPVDLPGIPNANDGADRGAYELQSLPPTAVTLTSFRAQNDEVSPYAFLALITVAVGVAWWQHARHTSLHREPE